MRYLVTKLAPLFSFNVHLGAVLHCCMSQFTIEMGLQLEQLFLYLCEPNWCQIPSVGKIRPCANTRIKSTRMVTGPSY